MQIEAWERLEAVHCSLRAPVCFLISGIKRFGDYPFRNNSPGEKLGVNFEGNSFVWMLMELVASWENYLWEGMLVLRRLVLHKGFSPPTEPGKWILLQNQCVEVAVIFGYLAV
ncbi:Hypothetical predicted protein [Pelobates cultripes]|uniref:Uncharacterized protein n=1 Tax=Pelobates cultripes TaxID=61616 RepID=A0AAD1SC37_PELCU|nr:Hypothetical predicted protein [Pelobates cultripes]